MNTASVSSYLQRFLKTFVITGIITGFSLSNAFICMAQNNDRSAIVSDNGIGVSDPKVFDNRSLMIMLDQLNESLDRSQFVDKLKLAAALGLTQGSRQNDISRSLNIGTLPIPGIGTESARDAETGELDITKSTSTQSEYKPTAPGLSESIGNPKFDPTYGISAQDLLGEQINLTYQVYNLRMLLERSLSDRLMNSDPRLQTVLGFQVSLDPPNAAKGAAAFVEVTVEPMNFLGDPVSLVALMPQEKTYNATALSTKSAAFAGAAVVKMLTVGYSERRRGQNFYLYQDADTITFQRMNNSGENRDAVNPTFGWQFRPVLGRPSVSPGTKQMFAVLSLPTDDKFTSNNPYKVRVRVRTYWRKYKSGSATTVAKDMDSKTYTFTKTIIPTTSSIQTALQPVVKKVRWYATDDKNAVVLVDGSNFFSGTSVIVGNKVYNGPATGLDIKSDQSLQLKMTLADLAKGEAVINGRYGSSKVLEFDPVGDITNSELEQKLAKSITDKDLNEYKDTVSAEISDAKFTTEPGSKFANLKLRITKKQGFNLLLNELPTFYNPVIFVQNTPIPGPYNYKQDFTCKPIDASDVRNCVVIQTPVPVDLLKDDVMVAIKFPFWGAKWYASTVVSGAPTYQVARLGSKKTKGKPDQITLMINGDFPDDGWKIELDNIYDTRKVGDKLLTVNLSSNLVNNFKSLILHPPNTNIKPMVLQIPDGSPAPITPTVEENQNLKVQMDSSIGIIVSGESLNAIKEAVFEGEKLEIRPLADGKKLTVFLNRKVTAKAGPIQIFLKTDKTTIPVDVLITK